MRRAKTPRSGARGPRRGMAAADGRACSRARRATRRRWPGPASRRGPGGPGEVLAAPSAPAVDIAVCLLDVDEATQKRRLRGRGDPEELLGHHVAFADRMRRHAEDPGYMPHVLWNDGWPDLDWSRLTRLSWGVTVIDGSELTVTDPVIGCGGGSARSGRGRRRCFAAVAVELLGGGHRRCNVGLRRLRRCPPGRAERVAEAVAPAARVADVMGNGDVLVSL
jgi:hypothetical protein